MFENIEAVLFDIDNTVWYTEEYLDIAVNAAVIRMKARGLNAPTRKAAVQKWMEFYRQDRNARDHFNRLVEHFNGRVIPAIIAAGINAFKKMQMSALIAYPDVKHTLDGLMDEVMLGIVSTGDEIDQNKKLDLLELLDYFRERENGIYSDSYNIFVTNDELSKPDPYLFEQAQKVMGFDPRYAVYVGDRYETDCLGARIAGLIPVIVKTGRYANEELHYAASKVYENVKDRLYTERVLEVLKGKKLIDIQEFMKPEGEIGCMRELADALVIIDKKLYKGSSLRPVHGVHSRDKEAA